LLSSCDCFRLCAYLTHAECKTQNAANEWMLGNTLEMQDALEKGEPVFPQPEQQKHLERLKKLLEDT
jgi:hypothetical protein